MKFSQPLVLLLGGVLSASGVGCSAMSAIVTDSRPAHRENHSDTDRIAAIGRVFENQGRYDKAEAMYRRALKNRPQDAELHNQLQQLAVRRKEQSFGPSGTSSAMAVADIVSPPKAIVRTTTERKVAAAATIAVTTASIDTPSLNTIDDAGVAVLEISGRADSNHQVLPSSISVETGPIVTTAALDANIEQDIAQTSGTIDSWRKSREHTVSGDDVLIALEYPDEHVDLLLDALSNGDSNDTRALAATLLGDCDPANTEVRNALHRHQKSEQPPELLLAICDSQIERQEADGQTLTGLFSLCSTGNSETQLQAASQLRTFAGTEFESSCLAALNHLLSSGDPGVRATAAVTLGDFASLDDNTISRLQSLVENDASSNVREAAQSALGRQQDLPLQAVPNLSPALRF